MSRPDGTPAAGDILVVCTANRARSPIAHLMLEQALRDAGLEGIVVRSAGTRAAAGDPVMPDAEALLGERGLDAADFRSTPLTPALVEQADLILCAERSHRSDVVRLAPKALRKTLTLAQAARLVPFVDPAELAPPSDPAGETRASLRAAHIPSVSTLTAGLMAARGHVAASDADDIGDPAGHPREAYDDAALRIDDAVRAIVGAIRATARPTP